MSREFKIFNPRQKVAKNENFKNFETKFSPLINENLSDVCFICHKKHEQNYMFCSNKLILDCNSKI